MQNSLKFGYMKSSSSTLVISCFAACPSMHPQGYRVVIRKRYRTCNAKKLAQRWIEHLTLAIECLQCHALPAELSGQFSAMQTHCSDYKYFGGNQSVCSPKMLVSLEACPLIDLQDVLSRLIPDL